MSEKKQLEKGVPPGKAGAGELRVRLASARTDLERVGRFL